MQVLIIQTCMFYQERQLLDICEAMVILWITNAIFLTITDHINRKATGGQIL